MSVNQFAHQEGQRRAQAVRDFLFESLVQKSDAGCEIEELTAHLAKLQTALSDPTNTIHLKENNG